ncbi:MAG: hypothetical protein B7Z23_13840, partial [Pseudomonadales bacterium 32-61-5]
MGFDIGARLGLRPGPHGCAACPVESGAAPTLIGSGGADTLVGGTGNDTLSGLSGLDLLQGGSGNDVLVGGTGRDTLTGGGGSDNFTYLSVADSTTSGRDLITDFATGDRIDLSGLDGNTGVDGLQGFTLIGLVAASAANSVAAGQVSYHQFGGNTFINIGVDADGVRDLSIEIAGLRTLQASDFIGVTEASLNLVGGAGADLLAGQGQADVLSGLGGNDTLVGGGGADSLTGGQGRDSMTGGDGADHFIYTAASDSTTAARDVITDFTSGDKINLQALEPLSDFTFVGLVAASAGSATAAGTSRTSEPTDTRTKTAPSGVQPAAKTAEETAKAT